MGSMRWLRTMAFGLGVLAVAACGGDGGGGEPDTLGDGGGDEGPETVVTDGRVVINEVAPAGSPVDWIELLNTDDESADLSGWTLTDDDPLHVLTFAAGTTLGPGERLLLERDAQGSFDFGLGATDAVLLYDAGGTLVDSIAWSDGAAPAGTSYGRIPDGTGAFTTLFVPTPGEANTAGPTPECGNGSLETTEVCDGDLVGPSCTQVGFVSGDVTCASDCSAVDYSGCVLADSPVVINEVTSTGDDSIELFNTSDEAVSLGGWVLTDGSVLSDGDPFLFLPGTTLPAKSFLVLVRGQNHVFGVGAADTLVLRNAAEQIVQVVSWSEGDAAVSYCRVPNGTGALQPCATASFGAENPAN